jgi:hypothetical protein
MSSGASGVSTMGPTETAAIAGAAELPAGAATGVLDPTVLADAPVALRAAVAFVLILLFGAVVLSLREGVVHRAVDASLERPLLSMGYGVVAQGVLVFLGAYGYGQLLRFGSIGSVVGAAGLWVTIAGALALSALGLAVVGAAATEAAGKRQPWPGLAIGAGVGAAAWLVPSIGLALLAWVLVVAAGIGGSTRMWFHSSRGATPDA